MVLSKGSSGRRKGDKMRGNKHFGIFLLGIILMYSSSVLADTATPQSDSKAEAPAKTVVSWDKFEALIPGTAWQSVASPQEFGPDMQKLIKICLKKNNGSLITVRMGEKEQFGMPESESYFSLEEPEMAWLVKLIPKGDYQGEVKLQISNTYLSHTQAFSFLVTHKSQIYTDMVMVPKNLTDKGIMVIDLLTSQANYEQDKADFFTFLESLKDKNKEKELEKKKKKEIESEIL